MKNQGRHRGRKDNQGHARRDPFQIWEVTHDPMLRWQDVPGGNFLAQQLMVNPDDPYLNEVYALTAQNQAAKALVSGDPFWGNYPSTGKIPPLERGRIPIAALPTGEVLSIGINDLTRNTLVVGPTGGGKTNFLRVLLAALLESL